MIAWWEAILEMLDSVVVCCFPLSVLRDWGLCLQTCLLFQPVFHTDLLKWPLPYSFHQENRGLYVSQSGKTSDRLLSCDPSWSVTHSFMLISSVFFCFSHSWVFKKSILLVSTFCLKELRLGAQRSLYFYKTTLEKIHLNFESNLIEKLINLVLCCLISHSLWRVSSLNLCY